MKQTWLVKNNGEWHFIRANFRPKFEKAFKYAGMLPEHPEDFDVVEVTDESSGVATPVPTENPVKKKQRRDREKAAKQALLDKKADNDAVKQLRQNKINALKQETDWDLLTRDQLIKIVKFLFMEVTKE